MKKFLFSVATIFAANSAFSQMTLEKSYTSGNFGWGVYYDSSNTNYIIPRDQKVFDIYDANHNLIKTLSPNVPDGYVFDGGMMEVDFSISKYVFNTDDKLEFILWFYNSSLGKDMTLIVNEDGNIIKQFGDEYHSFYHIFHDSASNKNKFVIVKTSGTNEITEVYLLPTTQLTTKEIQGKNKLSAFPIPTNKILNIINPKNGANKIEVFDSSGKLVLNRSFANSENNISIDVEILPKGIYFYKVGELGSKFIKN